MYPSPFRDGVRWGAGRLEIIIKMLEFRDIKKYYAQEPALHIAELMLDTGIYWIKGANGSGKTTLLKMAAALLPFEGDIIFKGISLKHNAMEYRRHISWAEAEPLYPSFITGKDLLTLYKKIRKAPDKEMNSWIDFFGMNEYIGNAVGTYSAGMVKKLSLALAFTGNLPLILLDEPLITLDAATLQLVSSLILDKHKQNGTTFLLSSHQDADTELFHNGKKILIQHKSAVHI